MDSLTFTLQFYKNNKTGICYREGTDRIGRVYLPAELAKNDRVTLEVAASKETFTSQEGYLSNMGYDKETPKKIRFKEQIGEPGLVGYLYVGKDVLNYLGLQFKQDIAVRICSIEQAAPAQPNGVVSIAD